MLVTCLEPRPPRAAYNQQRVLSEVDENELLIGWKRKSIEDFPRSAVYKEEDREELLIGTKREWPHGRPTLREDIWRQNAAREEPETWVISLDDVHARDVASQTYRELSTNRSV